jgi:hypothetical protein
LNPQVPNFFAVEGCIAATFPSFFALTYISAIFAMYFAATLTMQMTFVTRQTTLLYVSNVLGSNSPLLYFNTLCASSGFFYFSFLPSYFKIYFPHVYMFDVSFFSLSSHLYLLSLQAVNGLFNEKHITVREVMKSMLDFWLRGTYEVYSADDDREDDKKSLKTVKKSDFSSSTYRNKKGTGTGRIKGCDENVCHTREYLYDVEEAKEEEEEEASLIDRDSGSSTNTHVHTYGEYTDDECDGQLLYRMKKKRPKKAKCCEHSHDETDDSVVAVKQTEAHTMADDR